MHESFNKLMTFIYLIMKVLYRKILKEVNNIKSFNKDANNNSTKVVLEELLREK